MEENYTVYMHTNKTNNKKYIGITRRKPKERWNKGNGYKNCLRFKNAINKYGWDNFEHKILYEHLSQQEAESYEIKLIKEYNTTNEKYGYNIQNGGNSVGKMTQETKDKIGLSNSGHEPILQFDRTNGKLINEFQNLMIASEKLNISKTKICAVCNYRVKSIGGYIFRYKNTNVCKDGYLLKEDYEKSANTHLRPVRQYTREGVLIKEYPSLKDAELSFGKAQGKTHIWHCINHIMSSSLGYLWSYADEDLVIMPPTSNKKQVEKFDLNNNYICSFDSVKEAVDSVKGNYNTLIIHLKSNKIKPYKNYIWKYA